MKRDLVIIESPGKLKTLHRVFEDIGLHADVCATIGHFLENPPTLNDVAIEFRDGEFVEPRRLPFRGDSYRYLCDQIQKCSGRILVATDNDQEGHVIAQDVAALVKNLASPCPVLRMLMGGLDRASIVRALGNLKPIEPAKAMPGTARRIADRLIGACMSDFANGKPVGRVQSALLGHCATTAMPHGTLRVKMPCTDGGKPFIGDMPITGAATPAQLIAELGGLDLPPAPIARSEVSPMSSPLAYGDALLELHGHLDLGISDAADLLQRLYENGDISYPRTASHGLTELGIESVARIARLRALIAFKKELLPRIPDGAPHEAIRVLDEGRLPRDISKPLKLLSDRDAALALVARHTLEAGLFVRRDYPELSRAPAWTHDIAWRRDSPRAILPWRYPEPPQARRHHLTAALVQVMMDHGIGRPSTYASHASRFAGRELLNDNFELTPKGRDWLAGAPEALKRPGTSGQIEALLDNEQTTVAAVVDHVLTIATGGEPAALEAIHAQLENPVEVADAEDPDLHYRPAF